MQQIFSPPKDDRLPRHEAASFGGKEVLVFGSSPAMLLEALTHSQLGSSVTIVDERPQIGGAWATQSVFGCHGVEVGCHFIEPNPETYAFMRRGLQLRLAPMTPQPMGFFGKFQFSRATLQAGLEILASSRRFRLGRLCAALPRLARALLLPKAYEYPVAGCREIVARLRDALAEENITIKTDCEVRDLSVSLKRGIVRCETSDGCLEADQAVMGSSWRLGEIQHDGGTEQIASTARENCHVVLRVAGKKARPFTFVEVARDPFVSKLSDVTPYARLTSGFDGQLIVCGLFSGESRAAYSDDALIDQMLAAFKRLGLLTAESKVIEGQVFHFDFQDVPEPELLRLGAKFSPVLQVLPTRNLSASVASRRSDWERALAKSRTGSAPARPSRIGLSPL